MCYCATVEETEEEQTINSLEVFATLDGGATKTVSGFTSDQQVVNQQDDTTIETTDVGFTFVGCETEAASTIISARGDFCESRVKRSVSTALSSTTTTIVSTTS